MHLHYLHTFAHCAACCITIGQLAREHCNEQEFHLCQQCYLLKLGDQLNHHQEHHHHPDEGGFQLQDGAGPWQQLWGTQPNHQQMERPCPGTFFFLILFSLCLLTTSQHILSGANGEHWRHCGGCNDDQLCSRKCHRLHKAFHEPGHFYPFQGEKTLGKWVCCIVFYYTPISTAVCNTFVHTYCLEIGY